MSIRCMNWAWDIELLPAVKLVLLKLSDRADDDGRCWPGHDSIAAACNMSERSVMRHIGTLEKMGYVHIERRKDESGRQITNLYFLNLARVPGDKLSPGESAEPGDNQGISRVTTVSPVLKEEPSVEPSLRACAREAATIGSEEVWIELDRKRIGVVADVYDRWVETYRRTVDPAHWSQERAIDWLETELAKAENWLFDTTHPKRLKAYRDWKKFLVNWLENSLKPKQYPQQPRRQHVH